MYIVLARTVPSFWTFCHIFVYNCISKQSNWKVLENFPPNGYLRIQLKIPRMSTIFLKLFVISWPWSFPYSFTKKAADDSSKNSERVFPFLFSKSYFGRKPQPQKYQTFVQNLFIKFPNILSFTSSFNRKLENIKNSVGHS